MRYLSWILTIPIALLAVSFAVSNLEPVSLGLWPLPHRVDVPAYALVLVTLVLGFLLGGVVAWWSGHAGRKQARIDRARADRLERELLVAKDRADTAEAKLAAGNAAATAAPTLTPPAANVPAANVPAIAG